MSREERPVVFDPQAVLWAAVAEGCVRSSEISPSGKFKIGDSRYGPVVTDNDPRKTTPLGMQNAPSFALQPPVRAVSPVHARARGRRDTRSVGVQTDNRLAASRGEQVDRMLEDMERMRINETQMQRRLHLAETLVRLLAEWRREDQENLAPAQNV